MYVTLKLDDNGCCRIHSISDDVNQWIVINERYVVMPWKMVTRHGKNMTLKEAVDSILNEKESKNKELERRNIEKEKIEKKRKEYYEKHMKEETKRLNKLADWYKFKLDEIREAPVDSRPRKLEKLHQSSEKNKHLGVTITRTGTLNPVDYPRYPPKLKLHEYEDNEEDVITIYQGRDEDLVKYVKKVKALIDKPLDEMIELGYVRLAMAKIKCPRKLDISMFYQLSRRLPHKDLN